MSYNGPDRRSKSTERRSKGQGKPPPGTVIDRRLGLDPRNVEDLRTTKNAKTLSAEAEQASEGSTDSTPTQDGFTGLERKRGRGRRLSDFTKSAEEGEMTTEQFLFLMAIDAFKKGNDRMFPTWTDVLEVIRLLGYRKTMPTELNLPSAEDWLERSDSPANVRPDRWAERFTEKSTSTQKKQAGPKSDEELTDEALEAFEAAFGSEDEVLEADEFMGEDFDSDFDSDGVNEAA